MQLLEPGDFSVTYAIADFPADPKHLLTVRSRLRKAVLDTSHAAGVEIVSPFFMNQRSLSRGAAEQAQSD